MIDTECHHKFKDDFYEFVINRLIKVEDKKDKNKQSEIITSESVKAKKCTICGKWFYIMTANPPLYPIDKF